MVVDMRTGREFWIRHRGELNHDWLKNQFGTALRAHRNSIRGLVTNPSLDNASLGLLLMEWESRVSEMKTLISTFEEALSPSALFEEEPLRNAGFRPDFEKSLRVLVHDLWKRRMDLPNLVSMALEKLDESRSCATRLRAALESNSNGSAQILDGLTGFLGSIRELSEALSAFPRTVEVF
jgi:hypothetical protein